MFARQRMVRLAAGVVEIQEYDPDYDERFIFDSHKEF